MNWNLTKLAHNFLVLIESCFKFLQGEYLIQKTPNCGICGDVMKMKIEGQIMSYLGAIKPKTNMKFLLIY